MENNKPQRHPENPVVFFDIGVGGHAVDYYLLMDGAEPGDVELPSGRYSEQLVRLDTMGAYYRRNESGQLRASASRGAYAANSTTLRAVDGRRRLYACPQHCLKFPPPVGQRWPAGRESPPPTGHIRRIPGPSNPSTEFR